MFTRASLNYLVYIYISSYSVFFLRIFGPFDILYPLPVIFFEIFGKAGEHQVNLAKVHTDIFWYNIYWPINNLLQLSVVLKYAFLLNKWPLYLSNEYFILSIYVAIIPVGIDDKLNLYLLLLTVNENCLVCKLWIHYILNMSSNFPIHRRSKNSRIEAGNKIQNFVKI